MWSIVWSSARKLPPGPTSPITSTASVVVVDRDPAGKVADEAEDLRVEDHLLEGEDAGGVQQPGPGQHVRPGEEADETREPVLQARLPVGRLRAGGEGPDADRKPVVAGELGEGGLVEQVLGAAAGDETGPQVHRRRAGAVEGRGAGRQRLDDRHPRQHLGVALGEHAGGRRRGRGAADRHHHEARRHAGLCVDQGGLEGVALEGERAQAHLERREDRPGSQRIRASGDGTSHLDGAAGRKGRDRGHELDVLAAVRQLGPQLVERADRDRSIAGLDALPEERDLRERIGESRHLGQVGLGGGTSDAGLWVEDLRCAPVDRQVAVRAVERQVPGRLAGRERVGVRRGGEGSLDERGRQPHADAVDAGTGGRQPVPDRRRPDGDAGLVEDAQAGGVHPGQAVGREGAERRLAERERPDGRGEVGHRASPLNVERGAGGSGRDLRLRA